MKNNLASELIADEFAEDEMSNTESATQTEIQKDTSMIVGAVNLQTSNVDLPIQIKAPKKFFVADINEGIQVKGGFFHKDSSTTLFFDSPCADYLVENTDITLGEFVLLPYQTEDGEKGMWIKAVTNSQTHQLWLNTIAKANTCFTSCTYSWDNKTYDVETAAKPVKQVSWPIMSAEQVESFYYTKQICDVNSQEFRSFLKLIAE